MTQDIIYMASECGLIVTPHIEAFAKLVEAHTRGQIFKPDWDNYRQGLIDGAVSEREACAKVCAEDKNQAMDWMGTAYVGKHYADLIRARGNT